MQAHSFSLAPNNKLAIRSRLYPDNTLRLCLYKTNKNPADIISVAEVG
jgi:hypothetical protein